MRTTAQSHRGIGIVEVMGRHSGYIALGTAYGQPDIILVPEVPVRIPHSSSACASCTSCRRTWSSSAARASWGRTAASSARAVRPTTRRATRRSPSASDLPARRARRTLRGPLLPGVPPRRVRQGRGLHPKGRPHPARRAPHPRPVPRRAARRQGRWRCCSTARTTRSPSCSGTASRASTSTATTATRSRRWGAIHARYLHPSFYDEELMRPSKLAVEYMLPIFTQRDRPRRHRGHPPLGLRLGQPLPALPLRQHRHQQAHPLPAGSGLTPSS